MMMIDLVWFPTPRWLRARDTSPTQQCFRHVVLDASARRIGSVGRKMIYLFFPLPCWQLCVCVCSASSGSAGRRIRQDRPIQSDRIIRSKPFFPSLNPTTVRECDPNPNNRALIRSESDIEISTTNHNNTMHMTGIVFERMQAMPCEIQRRLYKSGRRL